MGKRGFKPMPTAEKRRLGNPGKRPLNDHEPQPTGRPVAPDFILTNEYASGVWSRVLLAMPEEVFTACDTDVLAAYCCACSLHRESVIETNQVMDDQGKPKAWVKIRREQAALIASLGTRLGLDPSARAAIKLPDKKPAGKFGQYTMVKGGKP